MEETWKQRVEEREREGKEAKKRRKGGKVVSSIGRYIPVIGVKPRLHACKGGTKAG